jgi:2-oxoglutarate dehydrogenase E2 component (dihydrolipoamide succinyltransferase)
MATEIRVPTLGESVTEATIGRWFKQPGEPVKLDEPLLELETDKVTLEVNAPVAGVLGEQLAREGQTVAVNAVLGSITEGAAASGVKPAEPKKTVPAVAISKPAPSAAAPASARPALPTGANGPAVERIAARMDASPRATCWVRPQLPRGGPRHKRLHPRPRRFNCAHPHRATMPLARNGCG